MSVKTYRYIYTISTVSAPCSTHLSDDYQDHVLLSINWAVTSNNTLLDSLSQNSTFAAEQLALWQANRTGYLVNSAGNQWGWLRIPDNETSVYGNGVEDPSSGPTAGHYEFIFEVRLSSHE